MDLRRFKRNAEHLECAVEEVEGQVTLSPFGSTGIKFGWKGEGQGYIEVDGERMEVHLSVQMIVVGKGRLP